MTVLSVVLDHTAFQHQILLEEHQFDLRVNCDKQSLKKIFG